MRSRTEYLVFHTKNRKELVNITEEIRSVVKKSGVREGFCLVSAMHITAGIWVNDEEDGLKQDLMDFLEVLAPYREGSSPPDGYRHHRTGEDNGDAHLKRTLLHHQAVLPVTKGDLDLGPWEQVFYAEFDGRRRKRVILKVIGE